MDASDNNSGRKRSLLLGSVLLIFIIVALVIDNLHRPQPQPNSSGQSGPQADVILEFKSQADSQGVTVTFNNKALAAESTNGSQWTYALSPGSYTVAVSKPGYKPISESFTAFNDKTTLVNVNLQATSTPQPIANISQVATSSGEGASLASSLPAASTITKAAYFDENTWAVLTINTHNGLGFACAVAEYDPSPKAWVTVYGPSDDFEESALQQMPSDVQSYVDNNFYVEDGGT